MTRFPLHLCFPLLCHGSQMPVEHMAASTDRVRSVTLSVENVQNKLPFHLSGSGGGVT